MILKIKLGTGFRGLDKYVTSKPESSILATNMAGGDTRERAAEIAGLRSARPDLLKCVGHLVLSHDPSLPDLTEGEWRAAIDIARTEHDLRDAPFVAALHRDVDHRHVHLFSAHSAGGWLGCLGLTQLQKELGGGTPNRRSLRPTTPDAGAEARQGWRSTSQ